jgi:hypothetical protein
MEEPTPPTPELLTRLVEWATHKWPWLAGVVGLSGVIIYLVAKVAPLIKAVNEFRDQPLERKKTILEVEALEDEKRSKKEPALIQVASFDEVKKYDPKLAELFGNIRHVLGNRTNNGPFLESLPFLLPVLVGLIRVINSIGMSRLITAFTAAFFILIGVLLVVLLLLLKHLIV